MTEAETKGIPVKTITWEHWGWSGRHKWRVMWRERSLAIIYLRCDENGAWYELSCPNLATTGEFNTRFDQLRDAKAYAEEMVRRCGAKRMTK